jgi:hypothetical protein
MAAIPGDRSSDSSFNFLEAPESKLKGVGIEQRKMMHHMIDTFTVNNGSSGGSSTADVHTSDETQPFLDADFRLMYNASVSCLLRMLSSGDRNIPIYISVLLLQFFVVLHVPLCFFSS